MPDPVYGFPTSAAEVVAAAVESLGQHADPLQRLAPTLAPADRAELWSALRHLRLAHTRLARLAGTLFAAEPTDRD